MFILQTNYNNPTIDTSNPRWAGQICHNIAADDPANVVRSNPVQEWAPVLTNDELSGDVGISGTVVLQQLSGGTNKMDFGADMPFLHPFYNDWEFYIAPDSQSLLAPGNLAQSDNDTAMAKQFVVENKDKYPELANATAFFRVEIDQGLVPPDYRALPGDRVAVFGRWIVDCGHSDFQTEIHPPLLLATARPTPSGTGTSVKVLGRAFLVSQLFDGVTLIEHLRKEALRIHGEASAASFFPPALALIPPASVRPKVISPPFSGIRWLFFDVRPPTPRQSSNDQLLLSFHFTVRTGVAIEVTKGPEPDAVRVNVVMNDVNYKPANPPNPIDVTVQITDLPVKEQAALALLGFTDPIIAPVIVRGIQTTRYDLPSPQSVHDNENVVSNVIVDQGIAGSIASTVSVDDNQPYPIYGWLTLHWNMAKGKEGKDGKDKEKEKEASKDRKDNKENAKEKDNPKENAKEKDRDFAGLVGGTQANGPAEMLLSSSAHNAPLTTGQAFIRPDERPVVGERVLQLGEE